MTTHTPGPWIWADGHAGLNSPSLGPVLDYAPYEGMWVPDYSERGMADARLIAAAPDLLEALLMLVQAANGPWDGAEQTKYTNIAQAKARAAIAKATK